MARRSYTGGATALLLSGSITSTTLTIVTTGTATGWPDGSGGQFLVVIDRGLATEEKLLVNSRTANTLTVAATGDRGKDNTTAQSHSSGAAVEHVVGAMDLDEPNRHINTTTDDNHTQYLKTDGTRAPTGITAIAAIAGASAIGDTAAKGTGPTLALSDHRHSREAAQWISHTFAVAGDVAVPSGSLDYICPMFTSVNTGRTVKLAKCRYVIQSGTSATVKLQVNGVDATGFTAISVTTTAATTDPANITLADGDMIALVVTAISGTPRNLSMTITLEHA